MRLNAISQIAYMGAGLGHRREIHDGILAARNEIGFLEIITEKYISASNRALDLLGELAQTFVVIPHGVSLSVGTACPTSPTFMRGIKEVCDLVNPPYYSDHLAVTQSAGLDIGHLSPIVYNETVLGHVIDNINRIQDFLGLPFVLENITETHIVPGGTLDTADFFQTVIEKTQCGVLLDVTNLYTNSVNMNFDALTFAKRLPLDAVVQVHLAGGIWVGDQLIDSHSESVPEKVWELFEQLLPFMNLKGALVERDDNYPDFSELLSEVRLATKYMDKNLLGQSIAA